MAEQPRVLLRRSLGFAELIVIWAGGSYWLTAGEQSVRLAEPEVTLLLNQQQETILANLDGIPNMYYSGLAQAIRASVFQETPLAAFMDSTIFNGSVGLMRTPELHRPNAAAFFDLACLCQSIVFDDLIYLPNTVDVPTELAHIVSVSPIDEVDFSQELYSLGVSIQSSHPSSEETMRSQGESDGIFAINRAWSDFLARTTDLDYNYVSAATDSPGGQPYEPGGSSFGYDPIHLAMEGASAPELNEAISIQTWRYFVNERRASIMGVPYLSTSLRFPVQVIALRNVSRYRQLADQLLGDGGSPLKRQDAYLHPAKLPDVMGVILRKAKSPGHILPRALELRERFTPVRERIREASQSGDSLDCIVRTLEREVEELPATRSLEAIIAKSSAVATASGLAFGQASTALKIVAAITPLRLAHEGITHVVKPELRVLRSFRSSVEHMKASSEDVARIWRCKIDRGWLDTASRLSDISPLASVKMRSF